ncbi:MAG: GTPase HflX [Crenarchaeota archaeon]|nr:GTPase HflX [Thermoproteota archaeon]
MVACKRAPDFEEALALSETAGFEVAEVLSFCRKPHPATYLGPGKLEELKRAAEGADAVIVYGNPKPSQLYRMKKELGVEVIDRTMLILKIFELHSGSKEAKLQTELARLKYELTLAREYVRRAKMGEQVDFLGPGEYAAKYVIKAIHRRMKKIEKELKKIKTMREQQKLRRVKRLGIPEIAVTGYTCAGKTAIVNALARLNLKEGPEMFTTIAPKHVRVSVFEDRLYEGIFIDTVGFIEGIPPQIIEAFHATLAEVAYSDSAVLVLDGSEGLERVLDKLDSSLATLAEVGFVGRPLVIAFNKIDMVENYEEAVEEVDERARSIYPWTRSTVPVSAKKGINLRRLAVEAILAGAEARPSRDIREAGLPGCGGSNC